MEKEYGGIPGNLKVLSALAGRLRLLPNDFLLFCFRGNNVADADDLVAIVCWTRIVMIKWWSYD